LDAEGSRHLPRGSAQERRSPPRHRARRSVLFGSAEDGRQALGHVEPDRAAESINARHSGARAQLANPESRYIRERLWIPDSRMQVGCCRLALNVAKSGKPGFAGLPE